MLLSLLRKVELPDVEFIFNLGDWPLEDNFENPLPIFGWCGSTEQTDIPLPTWDQTKNSRHALFRKLVLQVKLCSKFRYHRLCVYIKSKPNERERKDVQYIEQTSGDLTPWEEKSEIGYFRGRDSNPGRLTLCEMSMNHPEDVDARYVTNKILSP